MAGAVVLVGALVQGAAGFGLGLLAAPVVALLDPTLVPVSLLVVSTDGNAAGCWRARSATSACLRARACGRVLSAFVSTNW